jgi:hypothetical protein
MQRVGMCWRLVPKLRGSHSAGQASVELIAVLPLLLGVVLLCLHLVLAGHALWSSALAARAGARAELVDRDAAAAVRRALPGSLRKQARVEIGDGVRVRVEVPSLVRGIPALPVSAGASLEAAGG